MGEPFKPKSSPTAGVGRKLARHLTPRWLRNGVRHPRAGWRWLVADWQARRGRTVELDLGSGLCLRCHPASGRTFRWFLDDVDSRAELRDFRLACVPGMRLLDIGAHYGFFSLVGLALGGPQARVLAVEPSAAACRVTRRNLALADLGGERALALQAAAGPGPGELNMVAGGVGNENYLFAATEARPDAHPVPQQDLPGLAALAGWCPTHVKLDIEGFESELLAAPANQATLRAWHAWLFLELHCGWIRARGGDPAAVLAALAAAGYTAPLHHGTAIAPAQILALDIARLVYAPPEISA